MPDTEDALDEPKHKGEIESKQIGKGLDSFFLVGDQSDVDTSNDQDTAHSEHLKDQGMDITKDISVGALKAKCVRAPIKPYKIDKFTAQMVAMKILLSMRYLNRKTRSPG